MVRRYLAREVLLHFGALLVVLLAIFLVRRFDLLLAEAAAGTLEIADVFRLLSLRTLRTIPSQGPFALYLAVVLALGRLSRNSEIIAMLASGISPGFVRRSVLLLSLVMAAVIGVMSFSVRPWAAARLHQIERDVGERVELGRLETGRFYELGEAGQVIFAEARAPEDRSELRGVFFLEEAPPGLSVVFARSAYEEEDRERGLRTLRLVDGHRYEFEEESSDDIQITHFEEFSIRTTVDEEDEVDDPVGMKSTERLLSSGDAGDRAEFHWRLAMPVSAIILAIAAVPLGWSDPRRPRAADLLIAVLLYLGYRQLLVAAKGWIRAGQVDDFVAALGVHLLFALIALALFRFRRVGT